MCSKVLLGHRMLLPRILALSLVMLWACSSDEGATSSPSSDSLFHADLEVLPGFHQDTGLQPPSSPVQLQLTVSASGQAAIDASAVASGSSQAPVLTATAGSGNISMHGGFTLEGRLVVNVSGLPPYDGPVPGLKDVSIPFAGAVTFDPYLLSGSAIAKAAIAPTDLPPIPLPGGLPGTLKLAIQDGSTVNLEFHGMCAAILGDLAHYTGTVARSGSLVLKPTVQLEVPVLGSKSFDLLNMTIPIAGTAEPIDLGKKTVVFSGAAASGGEQAQVGECGASGAGGAGGTAGAAGQAATGGTGLGGSAGTGGTGLGGSAGTGGTAGQGGSAACATVGAPCGSADCCAGLFCGYDGSELICQTKQ